MRVLKVLVALAIAPLAVAASQNPGDAAVKDPAQCANADAHRNPQSFARERPADPKGRERTGCSPVAPAPPPPPGPSLPPPPPPPVAGGVNIMGTVFPQLPGWAIVISGPISASLLTDAAGNYRFTGVPAGTYVVCEVVQPGWTQFFPSGGTPCPSGFGYTFALAPGQTAAFVSFGNVQP